MSWRYRVMRQQYDHADEPDTFAIHEVYDNAGWTERPTDVSSESVDGLHEMLTLMQLALFEPVLDYETGEELPA